MTFSNKVALLFENVDKRKSEAIAKLIPDVPYTKEQLMQKGINWEWNKRYCESLGPTPIEVIQAAVLVEKYMKQNNLIALGGVRLR